MSGCQDKKPVPCQGAAGLRFPYFEKAMDHAYDYACASRSAGKPIVGILCEYTPRELILAAGGVSVCLCGGSSEMIAPAEEHLPANLCPLIKSTYGYHLTKQNPFLEMADLVVAETTCDGKKKMYEMMAESRAMYVLELPQKAGDADAFAHWLAELRKLQAFLEKRYGAAITPEKLRGAIALVNRYRAQRRKLAEVLAADAPPITGRQLLDFNSSIWCSPDDMAEYDQAIARLASAPPRADLAKCVRVLLTGVPMLRGAEKVIDIIERHGGLVVCMENCSGVKPVLQDVDERGAGVPPLRGADILSASSAGVSPALGPSPNSAERQASAPPQRHDLDLSPLAAIARKYFDLPCSVMTRNDVRLESLARLAGQYRAQCIVDVSWQACLTYDVESRRVKQLAEEALNLPYLRLSTDYSPNDAARIALRVEATFETVRARGKQQW